MLLSTLSAAVLLAGASAHQGANNEHHWHGPEHRGPPNPWHHGSPGQWNHGGEQGGCERACKILEHALPGRISYFNETNYATEQNYWAAQQAEIRPHCRFVPCDAHEVSQGVQVVQHTGCQFAVKSGGHASFAGGSNIQDGMTFDLTAFDSISVSKDQKVTSVGTGNLWGAVYKHLTPMNLTVIGGRENPVGVGGLTLGGGISFFSGLHGWACDNIHNFEVVLGTGKIVNANAKENTDLFFALRGGSNNFGIVTRLDFDTYPQGQMWGGQTIYNISYFPAVIDGFYWFNKQAAKDPRAALVSAAVCTQQYGCLVTNEYEYTDPVAYPMPFENFTKKAMPSLSDTTRVTNLTDITTELGNTTPNGNRQLYITITVENNAQLMHDIYAIFREEIVPVQNRTGSAQVLAYQPISEPIISHFSKNGGNALGVTKKNGPLTMLNMDFFWVEAADDEDLTRVAQSIIDKATALAKSRGMYNRFIYQNYAYHTQDVFGGYGEESQKRLIAISKKYDPQQVFQRLLPGYFKVGGGPVM